MIDAVTFETLAWRKASFCEASSCVEVSVGTDAVFVRSTQEPHKVPLRFDHQEWEAFVRGVKAGEFDVLHPAIPVGR